MSGRNVIALERREERAARAALARLSPECQAAVMRLRENVVVLLLGAKDTRSLNPAVAAAAEEMAAEIDDDVCTLLGFEAFALVDIPPEGGP